MSAILLSPTRRASEVSIDFAEFHQTTIFGNELRESGSIYIDANWLSVAQVAAC